jgi:hypothetical protein
MGILLTEKNNQKKYIEAQGKRVLSDPADAGWFIH